MDRKDSGQVLLIVVLVMVVFLVIGLSVVSRSIFNVRTAVDEEKSQRAFSAAEAGVEQALKAIKSGNLNVGNCGGIICGQQLNSADSTTQILKTTVTQISSDQILLNNGNQVLKDDGYDIWLSNYPDYSNPGNYTLTLYWGDPSVADPCQNAALEVVVITGTKASPATSRFAYDPCTTRNGNGFTAVSAAPSGTATVGGKTFYFKQTLPAITSGILARVIPLYTSTPLAVVSGSNISLPVQGSQIKSTGVSGGTARQVTLFQGYPSLPSEFFPYILFSK